MLLIVIFLICVMYNRHEEQNGVSEADSCETDIEKTENDMNYRKKNVGRKGMIFQ